LLVVLAGHQRYAHITALRGDLVNAALLGMHRVMSEDSVRRALARIDEAAGVAWLQRHLDYTFRPLLGEPRILDVDTTSNRCTDGRRAPWSATTRTSRAGRRTPTTPMRLPSYG
jgi:hypothetical protein